MNTIRISNSVLSLEDVEYLVFIQKLRLTAAGFQNKSQNQSDKIAYSVKKNKI